MAGSRRFTVGDHVHVSSMGKGIVREVRNGGRYLVEVKARQIIAAEAQLTRVEAREQPAVGVGGQAVSSDEPTGAGPTASIDLHGLTTDEAVAALDTFLNDAILAGIAEVRVIHGRSGGRLKAAVHARLKVMTSVRNFRLDGTNGGVTIVTL